MEKTIEKELKELIKMLKTLFLLTHGIYIK